MLNLDDNKFNYEMRVQQNSWLEWKIMIIRVGWFGGECHNDISVACINSVRLLWARFRAEISEPRLLASPRINRESEPNIFPASQ